MSKREREDVVADDTDRCAYSFLTAIPATQLYELYSKDDDDSVKKALLATPEHTWKARLSKLIRDQSTFILKIEGNGFLQYLGTYFYHKYLLEDKEHSKREAENYLGIATSLGNFHAAHQLVSDSMAPGKADSLTTGEIVTLAHSIPGVNTPVCILKAILLIHYIQKAEEKLSIIPTETEVEPLELLLNEAYIQLQMAYLLFNTSTDAIYNASYGEGLKVVFPSFPDLQSSIYALEWKINSITKSKVSRYSPEMAYSEAQATLKGLKAIALTRISKYDEIQQPKDKPSTSRETYIRAEALRRILPGKDGKLYTSGGPDHKDDCSHAHPLGALRASSPTFSGVLRASSPSLSEILRASSSPSLFGGEPEEDAKKIYTAAASSLVKTGRDEKVAAAATPPIMTIIAYPDTEESLYSRGTSSNMR
jgi:hypothetical protein